MKDVKKAGSIRSRIGSKLMPIKSTPVVISNQEVRNEYAQNEFDVFSRHKAGKGAQVQVRSGEHSVVEIPYGSVGTVRSDRVVINTESGEEYCVFAFEPEDKMYLDLSISSLTKPQTRLQVGYRFTFADGMVAVAKPKKVSVINVIR